MIPRRRLPSGVLAAAALLPPVVWLWPSLAGGLAPSFRDQGDFFYPLKLYTADRLRAGEIPLWNPLSGGGEPWLANLQSGVFYPPTLLFLIPSPALAAGLFLLLHFAIGAWGAWRFLKEEGVSDAGALAGAVAFAGCGFSASLSAYWNHFGGWAYLPAAAALARSGFPSRASFLGFAIVIGLQAMAGSPEISAATLLLAALLCLARRRRIPPSGFEAPSRRCFARYAAGAALGLALAGWALLPMAELAGQSERREPLTEAAREGGAVRAEALASLAGISADASGTDYLSSLYFGPLLLFAAAAAFSERERRRLAFLLAGIALAGVLVAMAAPPGSFLRAIPPLDRLRYPAKGLSWTFFALSMLAGLGADSLRFAPVAPRRRLLLALAGACALALLLLSAVPAPAAWAAGGGILALSLLLARFRSQRFPALLETAAALAAVISLAAAGRPLFRFVAEAEIRRRPDAVAPLSRVGGRVATPPMADLARLTLKSDQYAADTVRAQREALLGYTNLLFGISTVRTAAALATQGARGVADAIDGSPDPGQAAGAAGARVIWTPFRPARLPSRKREDFFLVPLEPYRPRISFLAKYRVEPDAARAWSLASSGQSDWRREVLLDREPPSRPAARAGKGFLIARLAEDRAERVTVEMTSGAPGLLVLADTDYPGWIAEEGGRRLPILRADGVFRAVSLPAGPHRVVFRYRPLSFYAGAALSLAALAAILILLSRGEPIPVGRRP